MLHFFKGLFCICLVICLATYTFSARNTALTRDHNIDVLQKLHVKSSQGSKVEQLETAIDDGFTSVEEVNITATFLSCNRLHHLLSTLSSFFEFFPEVKTKPVVLVDCYNSTLVNTVVDIYGDRVTLINATAPPLVSTKSKFIEARILANMDQLLEHVNTEYWLHIEDDWVFHRRRFIQESIQILNYDRRIIEVVGFTYILNGPKKTAIDLAEGWSSVNNTEYILMRMFSGGAGNFGSWSNNPFVARTADVRRIVVPFSRYPSEGILSASIASSHGCRIALLKDPAYKHVGSADSTLGHAWTGLRIEEHLDTTSQVTNEMLQSTTVTYVSCGDIRYLYHAMDSYFTYIEELTTVPIVLLGCGTMKHEQDIRNKYGSKLTLIKPPATQSQIDQGLVNFDTLLTYINTDYWLHMEEGWEFTRTSFLNASIGILQLNESNVLQVVGMHYRGEIVKRNKLFGWRKNNDQVYSVFRHLAGPGSAYGSWSRGTFVAQVAAIRSQITNNASFASHVDTRRLSFFLGSLYGSQVAFFKEPFYKKSDFTEELRLEKVGKETIKDGAVTVTFTTCADVRYLFESLNSYFVLFPDVMPKPIVLVDCYNGKYVEAIKDTYGDKVELVYGKMPCFPDNGATHEDLRALSNIDTLLSKVKTEFWLDLKEGYKLVNPAFVANSKTVLRLNDTNIIQVIGFGYANHILHKNDTFGWRPIQDDSFTVFNIRSGPGGNHGSWSSFPFLARVVDVKRRVARFTEFDRETSVSKHLGKTHQTQVAIYRTPYYERINLTNTEIPEVKEDPGITTDELNDVTVSFYSCNNLQKMLQTLANYFEYFPELIVRPIVLVDCYNAEFTKGIHEVYKDKIELLNVSTTRLSPAELLPTFRYMEQLRRRVKTEYWMHIADGYEFTSHGFLSKSVQILKLPTSKHILQVIAANYHIDGMKIDRAYGWHTHRDITYTLLLQRPSTLSGTWSDLPFVARTAEINRVIMSFALYNKVKDVVDVAAKLESKVAILYTELYKRQVYSY